MTRVAFVSRWLATSSLLSVFLPACVGTLPGPQICSERNRCVGDQICVLGRCRQQKTVPVSMRAARFDFEPEEIAWLSATSRLNNHEMQATFTLGQRGGQERLIMRFKLRLPPKARLQRALLVLDAAPQCATSPGRVVVELSHVLAPWRSKTLTRGGRAKLGLPMLAGATAATGGQSLRIDVTEMVRAWFADKQRYHGMALQASGDSATGACFSSGLLAGHGPRLSLFAWPSAKAKGQHAKKTRKAHAGGVAK